MSGASIERIDPQKLVDHIAQIYQALDVPAPSARIIADSLVCADMWGHSSHGVMRCFWYGDRIANGATKPDSEVEILTDTGPLLHLDGHDGIGQTITQTAVDLVRKRAREFGVACASIRNSGHFGTAMYFTRQLALEGMIGFLATNASPSMPPFGGVEKLLGNNPQSWAAPSGRAAPFVLDLAHTAVARGKIYLAAAHERPIPEGWALDSEGKPTTDPAAAIAGTLLPMAGHKGSGLAAMMDVLSGILSASAFSCAVQGPYVADKVSGAGHFLIAIDIAKIRPLDAFTADMGLMIDRWKASKRQDAGTEILYPGEIEHRRECDAAQTGINLAETVIKTLTQRAGDLGVKFTIADLLL